MAPSDDLFAVIDMGTNSIKMVIVQFHPQSGRFLAVDRLADRVCLGRDSSAAAASISSPEISSEARLRALQCLRQFTETLRARGIPPHRTRCVATSAVREAANGAELVEAVRASTGLDVLVLSGEEEARFGYSGVIQFLPVRGKRALLVDIGGGSTEFAIGEGGDVDFATSLKLGHLSLTQRFAGGDVAGIRDFIRGAVKESGLVEHVKRFGFDVAVGSSGTIGAVEKAVFHGYGDGEIGNSAEELLRRQVKRDWRFSRGELKSVVERLCGEDGDKEKEKREELFKKRAEFIVAGAVLLEEIFELLGIEEMEVSEYALGEGVVAEALKEEFGGGGFELNGNPRWNSVVRLATRFNDKKRVKNGARCAAIAKGIFEGLRQCGQLGDLDGKDLECIEAGCLLHSIGLFAGKKGYQKQSYRVIMEGNHLHGFSTEEIKLIALLARHHRKKFPTPDQAYLADTPEKFRLKVLALCTIIRISVILQRNEHLNSQDMELSPLDGGFRLILKDARDQPILLSEEMKKDLRRELEHFKMVFKQQLWVDVPSILEASKS